MTGTTPRRAVLTLATGKAVYVQMAANLARSFLLWHEAGDIGFVLATDRPDLVPADVRGRVSVLTLRPGQYGEVFSPKLHLDRMAPADATLFVDADCLCVGPLHSVFDRFAGRPVSVVGGAIVRGEWFGDVAAVCRYFGLPSIPKFNGGIYYLERGVACEAVYATARSLEGSYDELGLVRLRGRPNDELLMAIAMALHGQSGIAEDGSIMAEPFNFACGLRLDVLAGSALLRNTPGHPRYAPAWPLQEARPLIVHFLGAHTDAAPYTTEALKLERRVARGWPGWASRAYAELRVGVPARVAQRSRDALRPVYRSLFGTRAVAPSNRV